MNIYLFSEHTPDPEMLQELGGAITAQFKGTISDIHRRGDQITFTEALIIGRQTLNICQIIPAESIVVVEAPLLLQDAWLKAGVATLLIPQMKQQEGNWGSVLSKYCGLVQVHRLEVVTSTWSSSTPGNEEKVQEQAINTNERRQKSEGKSQEEKTAHFGRVFKLIITFASRTASVLAPGS